MTTLITTLHISVCFILIMSVLLQSGKSADLAGAFGGGGSQSVFGARGSQTLLTKVTTACAVLFMFTSLGIWILSGHERGSVLQGEEQQVTEKAAPGIEEKKAGAEKKAPEEKSSTQPETKNKGTNPDKK